MDWLGFFNGWRLVPIIMAFVALLFAALCPWVWPPVGDALESFALVYYVIFRFAITRFDLGTPGREPAEDVEDSAKG